MSKLTQFGSSIGQIANLPDEQLQKLIGKFSKNTDNLVSTKPTIQTSQIDPQQVLTNLFMGLSVFKLDIIYHELQKAQQELSAHDMVFKVLLPFFKKCKSMNLTSIQEKTLFTLVKFEVSKMVHRHYMKP